MSKIGFDVARFLTEYEKHPCLWDKTHEQFKNRLARTSAEEMLLEICAVKDVKALRRKIRSVRGTYNTEVRKIRNSKINGAGNNNIYVPKLSWFIAANRFLKSATETISDLNLEIKDEKNITDVNSAQDTEITDVTQSTTQLRRACSARSTPTKTIVKRACTTKFRKNHNSSADKAVKALQQISHTPTDEFLVFGNSVAMQLQNMPFEVALQLQSDIQLLITKTRLSYLRRNSTSASSASTSPVSTPVPPECIEIKSNEDMTQSPSSESM